MVGCTSSFQSSGQKYVERFKIPNHKYNFKKLQSCQSGSNVAEGDFFAYIREVVYHFTIFLNFCVAK